MNLTELQQRVREGAAFDYHLFYGHRPSGAGIDSACFSQWYPAPFLVDGSAYHTCEHYMMVQKARLFGDRAIEQKIFATTSPKLARDLGRAVLRFDEATWQAHREAIVRAGNLAKFQQHTALGEYLMQTGEQVLVEASPYDRLWGIGMSVQHPLARHPLKWQGLNLLGFALMTVRDTLKVDADF